MDNYRKSMIDIIPEEKMASADVESKKDLKTYRKNHLVKDDHHDLDSQLRSPDRQKVPPIFEA